MHGEGELEFAAARARTWATISDASLLAACRDIARNFAIEVVDAGRARVSGRIGSGFMALAAQAELELTDPVTNESVTWVVHGTASGHELDAVLHLDLADREDGGTAVRWTADGDIRGPFAEMGRRMLVDEGAKVLSEALDCLRRVLEA